MPTVLTLVGIVGALVVGHAQAGEQDLKLTLTSNGQARAYRLFVPDGFGKSAPGAAVVLFNGSGSAVDGLLDPWKDVARKDGVMLIGPEAFKSGAWRIPEDSPDFTAKWLRSSRPSIRSIPAASISSAIPAAPATSCCLACSSPNTSPLSVLMQGR